MIVAGRYSNRIYSGLVLSTSLTSHSDTVATTLTYVFYHLARSASYQDLIRQELSQLLSIYDITSLQKLPGLQSVITETLRLHPPLPTGGPRETGPEGLYIAGTYIPPYTTVVAPRYTIARREYFYNALQW